MNSSIYLGQALLVGISWLVKQILYVKFYQDFVFV